MHLQQTADLIYKNKIQVQKNSYTVFIKQNIISKQIVILC